MRGGEGLDLGEVGNASDAVGVGGQRYFGDGLFSQFISLKLIPPNDDSLKQIIADRDRCLKHVPSRY